MPDFQLGGCKFESRPGYFAPRSTQPSIPPGSVNEYQLRLGRQRQVWLIPLADETQGVQIKLLSLDNVCYTGAPFETLRMEALYKSTAVIEFLHVNMNNVPPAALSWRYLRRNFNCTNMFLFTVSWFTCGCACLARLKHGIGKRNLQE